MQEVDSKSARDFESKIHGHGWALCMLSPVPKLYFITGSDLELYDTEVEELVTAWGGGGGWRNKIGRHANKVQNLSTCTCSSQEQ